MGIFIALAGVVYLLFFSSRLVPEVRKDTVGDEHGEADASSFHRVEAVIGARFPGINKSCLLYTSYICIVTVLVSMRKRIRWKLLTM